MWECSYSREPIDLRLIVLRLFKRAWLIPAFIFGGAVAVFGVYFFYKTVITGRTYQVENIYYIDFAEDTGGTQYTWVNQYTWSTLADMDVFLDEVVSELGGEITREEAAEYSDCTVESDGRYLYLRCTTPDPELSKRVADAYENALNRFCDEHKEFNSITCEHSGEALENSNIRVANVSIIGGIIGLLTLIVVLTLKDFADTSVYIPATLEKRYHIKSLLTPSMEEFALNTKYLLLGKKTCVISVDEDYEKLKLPVDDLDYVGNICFEPAGIEKVRNSEAVVVMLKAGNHNLKQFERLIEELARLDIAVTAILLTGEDAKLIKRYYGKR